MKKILLFILISAPISAFSDGDINQATEFYKKGDYDKAFSIYQSLLEKEPDNPYLLYNAGNCLYKTGDNTKALVYFMKAFKILPRNKEIKYNMEFVAKQTGQNLFSADIPQIFYTFYYFFSDAELKAFSLLFLFIFLFSFSFVFWDKHKDKAISLIAISGTLFLFSFTLMALRKNSIFYSAGIIAGEQAKILSGPGDNFKTAATINRSKIIKIIEFSDSEYIEIGILDEGIKGWIKKEDVYII